MKSLAENLSVAPNFTEYAIQTVYNIVFKALKDLAYLFLRPHLLLFDQAKVLFYSRFLCLLCALSLHCATFSPFQL